MKKLNKIIIYLGMFLLLIPIALNAQENEPVEPNEEQVELSPELKGLSVVGHSISPFFDSKEPSYSVTVGSTIEKITIEAVVDANNSILSGVGSTTLTSNNQVVEVKVALKTDLSKTKTYKITVKREVSDLTLKELSLTSYAFDEPFNRDVIRYTAEIPFDVEELDVLATPTDSNMEVTIEGDENLIVGSNNVIITIKNPITEEERVYTVVVNRLREDDSEVIVEDEDKDQVLNNNSQMKWIIIIGSGIIFLALAGLGIYFYLRKKKVKTIPNEVIDPVGQPPVIDNATVTTTEVQFTQVEPINEVNLEQTMEVSKEELNSLGTNQEPIPRPDIIDEIDNLFKEEE